MSFTELKYTVPSLGIFQSVRKYLVRASCCLARYRIRGGCAWILDDDIDEGDDVGIEKL